MIAHRTPPPSGWLLKPSRFIPMSGVIGCGSPIGLADQFCHALAAARSANASVSSAILAVRQSLAG